MLTSNAPHTTVDSCPGVLKPHIADDGNMVRVRIPGGIVPTTVLIALSEAAGALGDGRLELTSRANIQIRGLSAQATDEIGRLLVTLGLLPSPRHERVRNIIASPLSGLDSNGAGDMSALALALDRALCQTPRLAELPGRFLFVVDDGRGDTAMLDADVRITALSACGVHLWPGDFTVDPSAAARAAVALAEAFLDERAADSALTGRVAWRIRELAGGDDRVVRRALATLTSEGIGYQPCAAPRPGTTTRIAGVIAQRDGGHSVVLIPPLGRIGAPQARAISELCGPRGLRVTPWRTIVATDVADLREAQQKAHAAGLKVVP